jgi:hypothetical protein
VWLCFLNQLNWHADFGDSGPGEALKQESDSGPFFRSVKSFTGSSRESRIEEWPKQLEKPCLQMWCDDSERDFCFPAGAEAVPILHCLTNFRG